MVIAIVMFFSSDKGGRITPPLSGFRPQVEIGDTHTSCTVKSREGVDTFSFDKEYQVSLEPLFPARYPNAFTVGEVVRLYEGNKLIASGKVVEI